jgi:uncharacterized protein (DUF427 family)
LRISAPTPQFWRAKTRSATHVQAVRRGMVIADRAAIIFIEGNHYFYAGGCQPQEPGGERRERTCPWKGVASYWDIVVGDERNEPAAWHRPQPDKAAAEMRDWAPSGEVSPLCQPGPRPVSNRPPDTRT